MKELKKLDNLQVDIFFDEWTQQWCQIELFSPLINGQIKIINSKQEYYIFPGTVISVENPFRISYKRDCIFHFSRKIFDKEVSRHVLFSTLPPPTNLKFYMRRINKKKIQIKKLEVLTP